MKRASKATTERASKAIMEWAFKSNNGTNIINQSGIDDGHFQHQGGQGDQDPPAWL
jgi:hypothetical protein